MAAWSKSVVCTRVIVLDKLIQRAASQLSDELPESREAACALLLELQSANEKSPILAPAASQLSDELPESCKAACELLLELQNANEKSLILEP
nr:armadillo-type fold, CLASP N-terminal domain protein [Tanacetum cinerariifolium]